MALLFKVGKYVIGFYLGQSNISDVYGAAALVVILLSWVYYSSMILYLGAEFRKVYAMEFGEGVKSASSTELIKQTEIEATQKNVDTIEK
jgi:membrane protein